MSCRRWEEGRGGTYGGVSAVCSCFVFLSSRALQSLVMRLGRRAKGRRKKYGDLNEEGERENFKRKVKLQKKRMGEVV